jgi:hypothetical protein
MAEHNENKRQCREQSELEVKLTLRIETKTKT